MFKRFENHGAVCSAWSSLEDNPRNRFLSRALLSSWCQDVVLFLDWRTPATALPGTGVEISHIIRCCLRCGDHGAMVLWWVARRWHSISSIVSVVTTRGGDTVQCHHCHVRPNCCSYAFYLGPKGSKDSDIVLSLCPECFIYNSRCGLWVVTVGPPPCHWTATALGEQPRILTSNCTLMVLCPFVAGAGESVCNLIHHNDEYIART